MTLPSLVHYRLHMVDAAQIQKNLRAAMKEALRIQDRSLAEPVFAKTGKGYLKSEGVGPIRNIKSRSC